MPRNIKLNETLMGNVDISNPREPHELPPKPVETPEEQAARRQKAFAEAVQELSAAKIGPDEIKQTVWDLIGSARNEMEDAKRIVRTSLERGNKSSKEVVQGRDIDQAEVRARAMETAALYEERARQLDAYSTALYEGMMALGRGEPPSAEFLQALSQSIEEASRKVQAEYGKDLSEWKQAAQKLKVLQTLEKQIKPAG